VTEPTGDPRHLQPLAHVEVVAGEDAVVARVTGELDMSNAGTVHAELVRAGAGAARLVVDLAGLTFIDSAGIAALDRLHRDLVAGSAQLQIVAPEGCVALSTLRLAGMDQSLPMARSTQTRLPNK
jgi:anti-sigma B factor antagonist